MATESDARICTGSVFEGEIPSPPVKKRGELFLGEIEVQIVRGHHLHLLGEPGKRVHLQRDPEDPRDPSAIRVEDDRHRCVGHLPRKLSAWLAPLLDAGKVRIDAHLPAVANGSPLLDPDADRLVLVVFLRSKGKPMLDSRQSRVRFDLMHEVVRQAYQDAQQCGDPAVATGLAEDLRPLERQKLLPETRLLLALMPGVIRESRTEHGLRLVSHFRQCLAELRIGEPVHYHNLTVFPLSWPELGEPAYLLLSEAIERGLASAGEVSDEGRMASIEVANHSRQHILIPEGQILLGAKQNRLVNVNVLLRAGSKCVVPVSCVEVFRWSYQSPQFEACCWATPLLRGKTARTVRENRAAGRGADSDQAEVWDEVARTLAVLRIASATTSLSDGFLVASPRLREYRQRLPLSREASGVLAVQGERLLGMDLFDSPKTFSKVWGAICDAYVLDALRSDAQTVPSLLPRARQLIERIGGCARGQVTALGLGDELEMACEGLTGAALLDGGRIRHLAAFGLRR